MFLIYSQKLHKMFLIYFALSYRVSGLLYCFILFFLLKLIFIFFIVIYFVLIFFLLLFFKNFALHHLVSFNFYIKFDFYFFIVVFILFLIKSCFQSHPSPSDFNYFYIKFSI